MHRLTTEAFFNDKIQRWSLV